MPHFIRDRLEFFFVVVFLKKIRGKKSCRGNEDIMKTLFLKVFRAPLEAQW